jgi:thioredoxin
MSELKFFDRLKENPLPVVVDFWAPWCGPCRAIDPIMKKLGADYAGRVDVWKVNADEQPELLRSLHIHGIPTLVAFRDGVEVSRRTGAASPPVLATLFDAALTGEKPAKAGLTSTARFLRLAAGTILILLAIAGGFSPGDILIGGIGVIALFSAVYDRCPIYKAITARLSPPQRTG